MEADRQRRQQLIFQVSQAFTPWVPISQGSVFAGRKDQLNRIIEAIGQIGRHAIIFGERGVGKTSLANVLAELLPVPSDESGIGIIAPRINCTTDDNYASVWRKVFGRLSISEEVRRLGFLERYRTEERNPADRIEGDITPDDAEMMLAEIAAKAILVVVIDEFDRLSNSQARRAIADTIKSLQDHSISATIVLVGVADSVDQLIAEHHSVQGAFGADPHAPDVA